MRNRQRASSGTEEERKPAPLGDS